MTSSLLTRLSAIILVLAIAVAGAGAYAYTTGSAYAHQQPTLVPAATPAPAPSAAELDTRDADARLETDPFIRSELFFGSERPNKPEVSDVEFKQFLDQEVTPRFPDGLTVLKGFGQFREADDTIVQESSFVLVLLYPRDALRDSSDKIEQIRTLYKQRFEQESVLRVDDPRAVRVSF
jgi:hypothetical protein